MSETRNLMYEALAGHVADQTPSERARTMTSSGMPYYIVPESMTGSGKKSRMACCCVYKPCSVHAQYFKPEGAYGKAKSA